MCAVFQIGTKDYDGNSFQVKRALSQIETLCAAPGGYILGPPKSRFGWTFFELIIQPPLQSGIESRFSDMMARYRFAKRHEKFTKFLGDYLAARGCDIRLKLVEF